LCLVAALAAPSFAAGGARYYCVRMPGKVAMPPEARKAGCCARKAEGERAFARPCCATVTPHGRELVEPPARGDERLGPDAPRLALRFAVAPPSDAPAPEVPQAILGPPLDLASRLSTVLRI
jgi:hypothetical protein